MTKKINIYLDPNNIKKKFNEVKFDYITQYKCSYSTRKCKEQVPRTQNTITYSLEVINLHEILLRIIVNYEIAGATSLTHFLSIF